MFAKASTATVRVCGRGGADGSADAGSEKSIGPFHAEMPIAGLLPQSAASGGEIGVELASGLVAECRVLFQRLAGNGLDLTGNAVAVLAHRLGVAVEDAIRDVGHRVAGERQAPGEHLVEHDAEGEDVGALIDVAAAKLLGRHVVQRADHRSRQRQCRLRREGIGGGRGLGEPEIEHLHELPRRDDQVRALDVAVDDAELVSLVERLSDLHRDVEAVGHAERAAGDTVGKQLALHILHRDEQPAFVFDEIVGNGDVRRAQLRGDLGLANQAGAGLRRCLERADQELERDPSSEPRVFGKVDLAHTAFAKAFEYAVLEDGCPRQVCAVRHLSIIVPGHMATLVRRLGLWSSIGLVIGITIGGGIFRTPAGIAARVPDPVFMLGVWVLGGVIVLCGALAFAELSAAMPETGGMYVYLREGWGRPYAFLYGWAQLVLIRASALGGISSVFGEYFLRVFGIDPALHPDWADYLAAGAIVVATVTNIVGVRLGALFAGISTVTKFGALAFLVLVSFALGGGVGGSVTHFASSGAAVDPGLFGLSLISVMWAYDGFADLTFASGEVTDPQRNLPRAIIFGTLAIIAIYLAANAAYLYVIPIDRLKDSRLISADTLGAIFGQAGVSFIAVVVMISTFGSLMGSMLASPRIFFAMADDQLFFKPIAAVHPKWNTPYVAILLACALGVAMVMTQTFEQLTDTFVLAMWPFYALSVAAIYRLRKSQPHLQRPYKVIGYPFVPAVFIAAATYLVINALVTDPKWTSITFAVVMAGLPVYYLWFRRAE